MPSNSLRTLLLFSWQEKSPLLSTKGTYSLYSLGLYQLRLLGSSFPGVPEGLESSYQQTLQISLASLTITYTYKTTEELGILLSLSKTNSWKTQWWQTASPFPQESGETNSEKNGWFPSPAQGFLAMGQFFIQKSSSSPYLVPTIWQCCSRRWMFWFPESLTFQGTDSLMKLAIHQWITIEHESALE